jgi:hypothetical protein
MQVFLLDYYEVIKSISSQIFRYYYAQKYIIIYKSKFKLQNIFFKKYTKKI